MRQQALFEDGERDILLKDVADLLSVSKSSVRNWIKTGCLHESTHGRISRDSFNHFKENIAGTEKLVSRANKSLKDSHDHKKLTEKLYSLIHKKEIDISEIGSQYEESLSDSHKNKEGIYYTPKKIAHKFFYYFPKNCMGFSFCDPCCGSGNFVLEAIKHGIHPEKIYGYDTDSFAVKLTREVILRHTGYRTKNIFCEDFLKLSLNNGARPLFDIIATNPPWGKKIDKEKRTLYTNFLKIGHSTDTSSLFFLVCLLRLRKNGFLGLLLQDAFFNVGHFEYVRKKALSMQIRGLIDFGKPFDGLLAKAKGIIIQKSDKTSGHMTMCETNDRRTRKSQDLFKANPKSILNFSCQKEEAKIIRHLYEIPHLTLAGKARFGLGIVTGNNKKFCINEKRKGYMPVLRGADIHRDKIDPPTVFIPQDLSLYQQVASPELFTAKGKLIYRFISSDLIFYYDTRQRFFLNSVNMLILNTDFPISTKKLGQMLNSKLMNWLFKSLFETHKVLRGDIESLPIHVDYFKEYSTFTEESFSNYLRLKESKSGTFRLKT